jgi:protein TonB
MGGETYRRVQAALRKALLPRFDYPMLARRRGWEGRVRIGVLVESDGNLRDIRVVESCGYRVLDEAALDDLREVDRLPEVNAWLGGEEISVILPIQYRLK